MGRLVGVYKDAVSLSKGVLEKEQGSMVATNCVALIEDVYLYRRKYGREWRFVHDELVRLVRVVVGALDSENGEYVREALGAKDGMRAMLKILGSPSHSDDLKDMVLRCLTSVVRVSEVFFDETIVNSLLTAIVEGETEYQRRTSGVCLGWLARRYRERVAECILNMEELFRKCLALIGTGDQSQEHGVTSLLVQLCCVPGASVGNCAVVCSIVGHDMDYASLRKCAASSGLRASLARRLLKALVSETEST